MEKITTFLRKDLDTPSWHAYMLAVVGPRPIAFVSTIDLEGRPNLAPFSFFNAFGSNPATLAFSPARRGRENTTKHTLHNVEKVPECVINTVSFEMVEQASLASCEFDEGINEFVKAGFSEAPSQFIKPPRVWESPASFECKVVDIIKMGERGGAANLVICEAIALHIRQDLILENGQVNLSRLDLVGRMGYDYYVRAHGDAIFELPKPRSKNVIGFDGLPPEIRESNQLTGNELARLANWESIPSEPVSTDFSVLSFEEKIALAKESLKRNQIDDAWKILNNAYSVR